MDCDTQERLLDLAQQSNPSSPEETLTGSLMTIGSATSISNETKAITKMMVDFWGNRHADHMPPEETANTMTRNIEKLVAKELYLMKKEKREAIFDELHGVRSRAVKETPERVNSSLEAFKEEIQILCNSRRKTTDTDINGIKRPLQRAHIRAVVLDSNYVTAPEFRIRFLRTEFFDVKKAVARYCRYLNYLWDFFGDVALLRQICFSDLSKQETKYLKGGQMQCLLSRDKIGRRIFAVFGIYNVPVRERARVEAYLSFAAISDDETTQITGAVCLNFFSFGEDSIIKFDLDERRIIQKVTMACPIRYTALHFCMPDEPVYYFFKTIVHSLLPPVMRAAMRVHTGSPLECNYALCQFGIPVDDIPKSVTGNIKNKSIQKFLKARTAIEEYRKQRCKLLNVNYVTKAMEDELVAAAEEVLRSQPSLPPPLPSLTWQRLEMLNGFPPSCPGTDSPSLDCIVFGDRVTYRHPPNVKFREYLQGKRHTQEQRKAEYRQQHGKEKRQKERIFSAEFLDEIIDEVPRALGYRFANYDKDVGWYAYIPATTPQNRQELRKKISQLMRDERKREISSVTVLQPLPNRKIAAAAVPATSGSSGRKKNEEGGVTTQESNEESEEKGIDIPYSSKPSVMGLDAKRFKKDTIGCVGGSGGFCTRCD